MKQLFLALIFFMFSFSLWAGNDVTSRRKVLGVDASGHFAIVDYWTLEWDDHPPEFPMFFAKFDAQGNPIEFVELPKAAGFNRDSLAHENYRKAAETKLQEIQDQLKKEGFSSEILVPLKIELTPHALATIQLPDGRLILERNKVLPRIKGQLQREQVDLWLADVQKPKNPKKLVKKNAQNLVVRSFDRESILKSAFWIKGTSTLIGFYGKVPQNLEEQRGNLLIWKDEK